MITGVALVGPAIVESPFTTIVIDAGTVCQVTASGSLLIDLQSATPD